MYGVSYHVGAHYYGIFKIYDCNTLNEYPVLFHGNVTCPSGLHLEVGSLEGTSELASKESKVTIGVVVSVILTILCVATLFVLYRKCKASRTKENEKEGLESFYTIYRDDQNHSKNPMDTASSSGHGI